ncbi:MAG: hypothetical protein A2015_02460 [Spirochaetes bacterium GWF1_31_7]|nr:MAG: hypothetical protein A2Y30_04970 [Spirochaetes bacterium GWE1_32_154]OHD52902.1 MAG: hypothetical protein A2Y29_10680 [Spirochaetes bacterium GWE2_31_10]OHD53143.1 MAG: hypothetical protein A2015_02460 [Spirochaetes bacterium GWF1_31_7]HBD93562.1 hypothetical protein [Spirochaetia bacterium]HBI38311.1 hypothetical protein [Spirochaetia bacterium]
MKVKSIFFCIFTLLFLNSCTKVNVIKSNIINGELDVSAFNFNTDILLLNGEWKTINKKNSDFTIKEITKVPGLIKNKSFVTYTLQIKGIKNKILVMKLRRILTAYTVRVNGVLLLENGIVSDIKEQSKPCFSNKLIIMQPDDQGMIHIEINVSNFHDPRGTGLFEPPLIGMMTPVYNNKLFKILFTIFLSTTLLTLGVLYLMTYVARKKNNADMYFGMLLIISSFRVLMTGERFLLDLFTNIPWGIYFKIEIGTIYLITIFVTLFIYSSIENMLKNIVWNIFIIISFIFLLLNFILPPPFFITLFLIFYIQIFIMISFTLIPIMLFLRKKSSIRMFSIASFILLLSSFLFNILYSLGLSSIEFLIPITLLLFMIMQLFSFSKNLTQSLQESQKYAQLLNLTQNEQFQINSRLDEVLKKRNKQLEEKIAENKKLTNEVYELKKLSTVSLFTAGIIEEINELSTQIDTTILQSESDKSFITITNNKLKKLTNQLRNFIKPKPINVSAAPLNTLLLNTAESILKKNGIDYKITLPEKLLFSKIDEEEFSIALYNIFTNAVEASLNNKYVDIFLSTIEKNQKLYNVITIKDFGKGINKEDEKNIFEPFFSTKKNHKGLGLSTALTIIKKHNGEIELFNEPGIGCTIKIILEECESTKNYETLKQDTGEKYILVIDDENDIIQLLRRMIISIGYIPIAATNGEEGISLYKEYLLKGKNVICVIIDLVLPGNLDGVKIMHSLLEINPSVIGILSTGVINDPATSKPEQFGFKSILRKPYSVTDFNDLIQSLKF